MNKILFTAVLLAAAWSLAACQGSTSASTAIPPVPAAWAGKTNPLGADAAAAGEEIFKANCASCHGPAGHGDGPAGEGLDPRPRNLAIFASRVGDDYLYWRINTGVDGTAMVPWKGILTDKEIWQVITFIRVLK